MRTRAGVVLIEDGKVALIERHRAGLEYFVFPGGGVDEGETVEQAAIREAMEELGVEVAIKQKVAIIHFGQSTQIYFLVDQVGGEFGSGTGEEYTDSDPDDPDEGVYIPVWMPIDELPQHPKVFPEEVSKLVVRSQDCGWSNEPVVIYERSK
jgi:8-oxo-dGTP pyrophosphatase MutT (NUDIX family)